MLKIIAVLLSLLIILSVVGCGRQPSVSDTESLVSQGSSDMTASTQTDTVSSAESETTISDSSSLSNNSQSSKPTNEASSTVSRGSVSSAPTQSSEDAVSSEVSSNEEISTDEKFRSRYNLGTCKRLYGNIVVLFLFADDTESSWDSDSLSKFQSSQIQKALTYLEEKAAGYGKTLKFAYKNYSVIGGQRVMYSKSIIKDPNENISYDALENICENMGYGTSDGLFEEVKKEYPNSEIVPIIVLNKDGTSYARTANTPYSAMPDHCVVFMRNLGIESAPFLPGNRASTIAHEILHLYGAEDFYDMEGRSALAGQLYPSDIMYYVDGFINRNKISDFTAYTVGWTDEIPSVCYNENWWK